MLPLYLHLQMIRHSRKNRRHLQCYMVIVGDVKEPTHLSQRVRNVVPGVCSLILLFGFAA